MSAHSENFPKTWGEVKRGEPRGSSREGTASHSGQEYDADYSSPSSRGMTQDLASSTSITIQHVYDILFIVSNNPLVVMLISAGKVCRCSRQLGFCVSSLSNVPSNLLTTCSIDVVVDTRPSPSPWSIRRRSDTIRGILSGILPMFHVSVPFNV